MHGDEQSYYAIPDKRDLAAQYLLLYEMSLPYGLDLNDQINVDKSSTRMLVSLKNANARELREMDEKARIWLKENAPGNMFTYGSGLSIIWAHISKRNINSMMGASFGALIIISILLMFALKSFRHGLLSLAPNLLPPLMAFGVWGLFVGQVGLGLSIVNHLVEIIGGRLEISSALGKGTIVQVILTGSPNTSKSTVFTMLTPGFRGAAHSNVFPILNTAPNKPSTCE